MTPAQVATYQLYLDHYDTVRAHWSSGLLVLVHGDSHLGNVFFHEKDGSAGFYDMQCVAAEHPMRDVAYHLILSCDGADLARNERAYVEVYLKRLAAKERCLSYDDAWREPTDGDDRNPMGADGARHLGGRVGGLLRGGPCCASIGGRCGRRL